MLTPEALLSHADWVERLARRLVRDDARAADVAQETLLAALERPPRGGSARAWLTTVTRNTARRLGREERARREQEGAGAEVAADVAEVAARATLSREVVGDVLALDEPYRSVVLLRWFEDLAPREIARRLDRPVETVKTQLQRAHEQLRERMAGRYGDERWGVALAPLLRPRRVPLAPPLGWALLAGALVMALGLAWWLKEPTERPGLRSAGFGLGTAALPNQDARPIPMRIVDPAGAPISGLTVILKVEDEDLVCMTDRHGSPNPFASGPEGRIALPGSATWQRSEVAGTAGWVVVADGRVNVEGAPFERIVVMAFTVQVEGRITSDDEPVPRARLSVQVRPDALPRLPYRLRPLKGTSPKLARGFWAMADDEGRYAFEVPKGPDFQLIVAADDMVGRAMPCPSGDHLGDLNIDLQSASRTSTWIAGRVVDRDGAPVANAVIDYGYDRARSGEDGEFRVDLTGADQDHVLTALAPGFRPARRGGLAPMIAAAGGRLAGLTLTIPGEPLTIRGQVVDAGGRPRADWFVALRNGTPFGSYGSSIEHEASGADGIGVTTDAEGRFELGGLMDREYEVLAHDEDGTYLALVARRVRAGTHDLVLAVADDALRPLLAGRVVDPRGTPLAGHTVGVSVDVFWNGFTGMSGQGRGVTTDEEGRFELHDVPWRDVALAVSGPDVEDPVEFEFPGDDEQPTLVVPITYRFVLEVDEASDVDAFELQTLEGEVLEFHIHQPDYIGTRERLVFDDDGRRHEISVTGEAAVLVLWSMVDGDTLEVDRIPLALERGVKKVIRR